MEIRVKTSTSSRGGRTEGALESNREGRNRGGALEGNRGGVTRERDRGGIPKGRTGGQPWGRTKERDQKEALEG